MLVTCNVADCPNPECKRAKPERKPRCIMRASNNLHRCASNADYIYISDDDKKEPRAFCDYHAKPVLHDPGTYRLRQSHH